MMESIIVKSKSEKYSEMSDHDSIKLQYNYQDDQPFPKDCESPFDSIQTFNLRDIISTSLTLESNRILNEREDISSMKLLANVTTSNIEGFKRPNIDLVCVLDQSGSMSGEKIDLVKNSFKYLIDFFQENDRLSVVVFNHNAKRLFPLIRMTPENKIRAYQEIRSIITTGGTDINKGLCHAVHTLQSRRSANKVSSIFLLSDGIDDNAESAFRRSISLSGLDQEFSIHTFGFGNDHDSKMMTKLADLKEGNFYYMEQFNLIDECFIDCFGHLMSITAKNVEVSIKLSSDAAKAGIGLSRAYGNDAMWQYDEEKGYTTRLANFLIGKSRNFVLEVEFPSELNIAKEELDIADIQVSMVDFAGRTISVNSSCSITVIDHKSGEKEFEPQQNVLIHYYRVNAALLMELAYNLCSQEKYYEAQNMIVAFIKEMSSDKRVNSLQFIENLSIDLERAYRDCGAHDFKRKGAHNLLGNARAQMKESTYAYSSNYYGTSVQQEATHTLRMIKSSTNSTNKMKSSYDKMNSCILTFPKGDTPVSISKEKKIVVKMMLDDNLEFCQKPFNRSIEDEASRCEMVKLTDYQPQSDTTETCIYILVLHLVNKIAPEKIKICEEIIKEKGDKAMLVLLKHPYNINRNLKLERKGIHSFHQFNYVIDNVVNSLGKNEALNSLKSQDEKFLGKTFVDFIKSHN